MKADGISQDDQDMNQAIEASLSDGIALDQFDEKPLEERLRIGDRLVPCLTCPNLLLKVLVVKAQSPSERRASAISMLP